MPQESVTPLAVAPPITYPAEIELTVKLRISVDDPETHAYYLTPTSEVAPSFLADLNDEIMCFASEILQLNGYTPAQLTKILNEQAAALKP